VIRRSTLYQNPLDGEDRYMRYALISQKKIVPDE
jgi:hypothetical protein